MKARSMKAAVALAGAMVSMALVASGCSQGADTADGTPAVTEITFWSWLRASQEVVDAFNKTHTDVQVKFEQIPGGAEGYGKLTNAVKAGNAPDVATVEYAMLPDMLAQGNLQDVSGDITDLVRSKFPAPIQELVTLGGKTWTVPLDAGAMVMFYRKDLFEQHKIAVPKTWDEFKTAAAAVKKADPKSRITDWNQTDSANFVSLNWQAGAKWFGIQGDSWKITLDSPESQKVAGYWQGLITEDLVTNVPAEEVQQRKAAGQVWTQLGGAWAAGGLKAGLPDQAGKWASAPLPSWDAAPASAMVGGSSFGVSKTSKKKEAALKFITWMTTTPEAIQARLASGASSTLPAVPELADVAAKNFDTAFFGGQDIYAVAKDALPTIKTGWTWGPGMRGVFDGLGEQIKLVNTGKQQLSAVYGPVQAKTIEDLKGRGINAS
ncbi:ABC transporter substrate-binding protein [Catellatospora bangladeshensis]|uniref:Sugar ABC transporter substrate-binding protein n=1 Tax=Catellatospora bangladeshensis TaxID=310355 RepID=A0A8J3NK28_9ACTN|nr:sugar ABC transporter substrate-binding protein [Catellatospora bangladeshensis]GIF84055.1 sugar ABC transporter substrate-binding protein [Catellatospora bangladeshensis]